MSDKYIWDDKSPELFVEALNSPSIQYMVHNFKNKLYDKEIVDDAAKDLNSIILKAADKSVRKKINKFKSKKNKQVKRHKEWFTPSLILLKREVGHKFSQNPSNPFLRGSFFKCLQTYRKARKSQMCKYNQESIEKLDSLLYMNKNQRPTGNF
jgi:hypothetical protein